MVWVAISTTKTRSKRHSMAYPKKPNPVLPTLVKTEWKGNLVLATLSNGVTKTYCLSRLERIYGRVLRSDIIKTPREESSDEFSSGPRTRKRRKHRQRHKANPVVTLGDNRYVLAGLALAGPPGT